MTARKTSHSSETHVVRMLHISDIHRFSKAPTNNQELLLRLLNDIRLNYVRDNLTHKLNLGAPDVVVVSGDLTQRADEQEFRLAADFLEGLLLMVDGDRTRIVIVPGNHDVNWSLAADSYTQVSKEEYDEHRRTYGVSYLMKSCGDGTYWRKDVAQYNRRWEPFVAFFNGFYKGAQSYSLKSDEMFTIYDLSARYNLVVVGLNSCDQIDACRLDGKLRSLDRHGVLNEAALRKAGMTDEFHPLQNDLFRVAVFHHPTYAPVRRTPSEEDPTDYLDASCAEIVKNLRFHLCLHGHIHQSDYNPTMPGRGWAVPMVGAGSFDIGQDGRPEGVPLAYNLITIDRDTGNVSLYLRQMNLEQKEWQAGIWNGRRRITVTPVRRSKPTLLDVYVNIPSLEARASQLDDLMRASKYEQARDLGNALVAEVKIALSAPDCLKRLDLLQSLAWYARSLIYTGETLAGIEVLDYVKGQLNSPPEKPQDLKYYYLILGQSYNDSGYAYWMNLGSYEEALAQLTSAAQCYRAADYDEGIANSYDNMGRVYAQLGYQTYAELLTKDAQDIRYRIKGKGNVEEKITREYRYALSLNSRAIVCAVFGQAARAVALSGRAYETFSKEEIKKSHGLRGMGLALLTRGNANRLLADFHRDDPATAEKYLRCAEQDIIKASEIFTTLTEPIRLAQAQNEWGCILRQLAELKREEGAESTQLARKALDQLMLSADSCEKAGFGPAYVDSCEDIAETYFYHFYHSDQGKEAKSWLYKGFDKIPPIWHDRTNSAITAIPSSERMEDYWQQLGKLYSFEARMKMPAALTLGAGPAASLAEDELRAITCLYLRAAYYFSRFLERPIQTANRALYPSVQGQLASHRAYLDQLFGALNTLSHDNLGLIADQILPDLQKEEGIGESESWLQAFYINVFGLLLRLKKVP